MPNRFKIEDIRLLRVSFSRQKQGKMLESVKEHSEGKIERIEIDTEIKCHTRWVDEKNSLMVVIEAFLKAKNNEFDLNAAIEGIFGFEKKPEEPLLQMLQSVNCPAILFPYLREVVSDITKRGGLDPLYMPPVNFVEASRKGAKKKSTKK